MDNNTFQPRVPPWLPTSRSVLLCFPLLARWRPAGSSKVCAVVVVCAVCRRVCGLCRVLCTLCDAPCAPCAVRLVLLVHLVLCALCALCSLCAAVPCVMPHRCHNKPPAHRAGKHHHIHHLPASRLHRHRRQRAPSDLHGQGLAR